MGMLHVQPWMKDHEIFDTTNHRCLNKIVRYSRKWSLEIRCVVLVLLLLKNL